MAHLKPYVYFGGYFEVETSVGTEVVTADDIGRSMSVHVDALLNYLEGTPVNSDEVVEHKMGWLARMSAPGYLDATDWTAHPSREKAEQYLADHYGNDLE